MGRRGPPPTPTQILRSRGSHRGNRPNEPAAPAGEPDRPKWVTGDARKIWEALLPHLRELGVLSRCDGNMIGRYCVSLGRWIKASAVLAKHGDTYTIESKRGTVLLARPEVGIVNRLDISLLRKEQEFGLSPSARARLGMALGNKPQTEEGPRFKSRIVG